jgi:Methyltransferase domain
MSSQQHVHELLEDSSSLAKPQDELLEVKGVRLKHFERVLIRLLHHVEPRYIPLPQSTPPSIPWPPWDILPSGARVHGNLPGQLSNKQRAMRKEAQVVSMMQCIFSILNNTTTTSPGAAVKKTIVDFGGGSGHLAIPLAILLPHCKIVVVDLKQKSLDFLHEKARSCVKQLQTSDEDHANSDLSSEDNNSTPSIVHATAISNLFTFFGDIESFPDPFHIGVALHVCGEATDVVLRKCAANKSHVVIASCCIGKLSQQAKDPYIYQATCQNDRTIQYPQSKPFQHCLPTSQDWNALASAADYNHHDEKLVDDDSWKDDRRNATRRTAKGLLELDRQLYLEQVWGYQTALTRMHPVTASPKHDIVMGYYLHDPEIENKSHLPSWCTVKNTNKNDDEPRYVENPAIEWTKAHLLHPGASPALEDKGQTNGTSRGYGPVAPEPAELLHRHQANDSSNNKKQDGVDWTWQEEQEIRTQLLLWFHELPVTLDVTRKGATLDENESNQPSACDGRIFVFPPGMGRRKRKIIHFVAQELGLAHWGIGKKHSQKTVSVGRRCVEAK